MKELFYFSKKLCLQIIFASLLFITIFFIYIDQFYAEAIFRHGSISNRNEFVNSENKILKKNKYNASLNGNKDRLNEYYELHKNISQMNESLRKISFNECRKVGYGNRLYSLLSSLVIGILTKSQLVVRWHEIEAYVDLPINIFYNNLTQNQGLEKEDFKKKFHQAKSIQSWWTIKKIDPLMKTHLPENALRYLFTEIGPYFMELCSNPKYFSKFVYYNLVTNETVNLALKVISNNKSTEIEKQENIFKVGFEVGGNLLNRFWRPNKSIQKDVEIFFEKYFRNNFVIGFQLRYHYLNKNDTKKFIHCAHDIEKKYLSKKSKSTKIISFKWFIASDSQNEINNLLKINSNKTFTTNQYSLGHIAHDKQSFYRAMLDVELLSLCNEIIVTGGSTFGWVAAMKSLKLPLFINGQNRMDKCLRSKLSEPPSGGKGPYASFRK
jgi:hypothetical protein